MNIIQALHEIGVRDDTLSASEKEQLDRDGYLALPGIMDSNTIEALRTRQAELQTAEGERAGLEVHQERGTDRLSDLINKDPLFAIVLTQPRVLAAIAHVLENDVKLSSLNTRNALPGQGHQGLHADWGRLETPGIYQVCNSLWLLDDFTSENGATRIVPGTHSAGKTPGDEMANPADAHPNQIVLLGKAGDVVVVNSHLWHGGTTNRTEKNRRVMHGYFCRRHQPQQLDQQKYLRQETWDRLSEPARVILGVHEPGNAGVPPAPRS